MTRAGRHALAASLGGAAALTVAALAALPARAAMPPREGGVLRLPTQGPMPVAAPAGARTPLEVALASATHARLYRLDAASAEPTPVLAAARPIAEEGHASVPLRAGWGARGPSLTETAREALVRALADPRVRWLFPDVEPSALEALGPERGFDGALRLPTSTPDLAFRLAAHRVALVPPAGRALGAFRGTPGRRRLRLEADAGAPVGAPWLGRVDVTRPASREAALRAFELGRLDASWDGPALYGDDPGFPIRTVELPAKATVLLLRNRARLDLPAWCAIERGLDRRRLATAGLVPEDRLSFGDEREGTRQACRGARGAAPSVLRLLVRRDDRWDARLAEALAGVLDAAGARVVLVSAEDRGDRSDWDARLLTVTPTLPSLGALVGEVLFEDGHSERAAALVRAGGLTDATIARRFAATLDAHVLGRRRERLTLRADLGEVPFDASGVPSLADVAYRRPPPPPTDP